MNAVTPIKAGPTSHKVHHLPAALETIQWG